MTLILTVANQHGVHQSSDYQLTDEVTGAPVCDRAGSKQLQVMYKGLHLQLAFTGIASVGRRRTIDWLFAELKALPNDSMLQDICHSLKARCTSKMRPLGSRGELTLVLAVATYGTPFRVAMISNADWEKPRPNAKSHFDIQIRTVRRPFHLISGYRDSVPLLERQRLKALATDIDRAPEEVREALETINATAAEKSHGYVSKGCWVSSLVADGRVRRFAALNVGERDGAIRQLLSGFDLTDWLKKNLQAAPGQELSVVQVAGMIAGPGDGVPLPPPEGDPRRFVLSGSSVSGVLRLPSGQHCAAIEIAQLDCVIVKRRNEASRVPFARIQLSDMQIGADFPRPKRPWASFRPAFAIDGVAVPRGWGYSVGHWIEGGVLHVEIPRASGSVRGLAFLGDDDELAISLVSGCELAWKPSEDGLTATLEADVLWRTRLHGTHG